VVNELSKKEWREHVESCGSLTNTAKLWSLLCRLSGKRPPTPPNLPVSFKDKPYTKPMAIASRFNRQFSSVSNHKQNPESRRVMGKLHRKHSLDPSFTPFTKAAVIKAINKSSSSTAVGPDDLSSLHL
jgi:hypothetical protein